MPLRWMSISDKMRQDALDEELAQEYKKTKRPSLLEAVVPNRTYNPPALQTLPVDVNEPQPQPMPMAQPINVNQPVQSTPQALQSISTGIETLKGTQQPAIGGGVVPLTTGVTQPQKSWWQTALGVVETPFHWLSENVEKPFASIVLAGATPKTMGTENMTWLQRQRAEYNAWKAPWGVKGLVETIPFIVAPNIIGGAVKGLGLVVKGVSATEKLAESAGLVSKVVKAGEATQTIGETEVIVSKFMDIIPRLKLGTKAQKLMISLEKSPKIAAYMEKFVKGATLEERQTAKSALSGAFTKVGLSDDELKSFLKTIQPQVEKGIPKYVKINNQIIKYLGDNPTPLETITVPDIEKLGLTVRDLAKTEKIGFSEAITANNGLINLKGYLFDPKLGIKPLPHEIKTLSKIFGQNFAKSVIDLTVSKGSQIGTHIIDALNFPRSVLASFDFSGIFRQGGVLFTRHPLIGLQSAKTSVIATFSQKAADIVPKLIKENKLFEQGLIDGMELLEAGSGLARQEAFMSTLASKIHFVRFSERGYVTGLNKVAWDTYYNMYPKWLKMGATAEDTKGLAKLIMQSVGRGVLPKGLKNSTGILNSMFFAPRLVMSRLELPMNLFSKSPFVRKEAALTLVSFLGSGAAILGLAKLGGASISLEPRSSDFGKIKIGNTRLDIWTGYSQYTRFLAQLVTGQSVSETGNVLSKDRLGVVGRMLQSKTSPALGLIVDLLKGQTYMGEDTIPKDTGALIEQIKNRVAPLFIQDMMDAINQDGAKGGFIALPGILGVGVTTYTNDVKRIKEQIAQEKYGMSWDEVSTRYGDMTQYNLGKSSPELQAAMQKQDEKTLGTNSGKYREEGTNIETRYQDAINLAAQEYAQTGDGVIFRGKVNDANNIKRAMYDERAKRAEYKDIVASYNQPLSADELSKMNPLDLARREYYKMMYSADMSDEFGNYNFDEATKRTELFRQQFGDDALKYVQEYMGIKFDAPPIFTELKKAQTILKPYWQIESDVIKQRGEPKTKWQQDRINEIVTNLRKRMKRLSPDVQKYYDMFYKQVQ